METTMEKIVLTEKDYQKLYEFSKVWMNIWRDGVIVLSQIISEIRGQKADKGDVLLAISLMGKPDLGENDEAL